MSVKKDELEWLRSELAAIEMALSVVTRAQGGRSTRGLSVAWREACEARVRMALRDLRSPMMRRMHRVPGPLAAGPGVSGLTRGASDATEVGSVAASEPRGADSAQECPVCRRAPCWGGCDTSSG